MLYGLYLSTAGMQVQEYRQSVMTNNLANAQTIGFKRDLAYAQARLNPSKEEIQLADFRNTLGGKQGGGVLAAESGIDFSQGTLKATRDAHDIALQGRGFFAVQGDKAGEQEFTRDGRTLVNANGNMVMAANGRAFLGADGNPIKINSNLPWTIGSGGQVIQSGNTVGQLALKNIQDAGDLQKVGENLLKVRDGATLSAAPAETEVRQGVVEESSVDTMVEWVHMMEGQRAFEANAKMIQYQDQTLQQINTIGRVA